MARQSRAPVTQIVQAAPVAQAPVVQVVSSLPSNAAAVAALSAKPYGALTPEERKYLADHERLLGKAGSGSYAFFGLSPDDAGIFSVDIRMIDLNAANAKKAGDGRPYLFSLDGQTISYLGEKWNVSTFYALRQRR